MVIFAKIALWAFVPFCLLAFSVMRPRHALVFCFVGGWLFLPDKMAISFSGLPDLTKTTAATFGVCLGAMLFDTKRFLSFRPRWFDLPMLLLCASPYYTSIKNHLGWWDGLSSVIVQLVLWGLPYYLGRVYFNEWEGFRELAMGIFIGGLVYIPFCLIEIKFSPQFHHMVYGYHQHSFAQTVRYGSYRPMVFMQSGLALAMWMTTASLIGVWLWVNKGLTQIKGVPMSVLVPALLLTTLLCKSFGALGFLFAGLGTLFWIKWLRNPLPLLVLMVGPPVYMYQRATMHWDGSWLVEQATRALGEERAQSLSTRIDAENLLTARAFEAPSPKFGWGRWSPDLDGKAAWRVWEHRIRHKKINGQIVEKELWKDKAPTDGLWVITLGQYGVVGLTALNVTIILPALLLWRRLPMKYWAHPMVAAVPPLAVLLVLHMCDNILNGMVNPIFLLAAGGISGLASIRQIERQQRAAQARGYPAAAAAAAAAPYGGMYPGMPQPGGYPQAGYAPAAPYGAPPAAPSGGSGYPGVAGFPDLPGLRAPSAPMHWRR